MEAGAGFHGPGDVWRSTEEAVKRRWDAELGERATEQPRLSTPVPLTPSLTLKDLLSL